ncbi:hypothetical protein N7448_001699 [Penicillium atrosanguineum]|uniref:Uncharacterized protein n=1 Tax=Penicillium atrosanguineum TaxID=1132637 RepID=A0A9W9LDG6_9EURO|nr:Major facilitator superfamily domain general substrate transporter [Penicillium atrosanguineum]KAJ5133271.1 hypothetical protein N7526_004636 [Penicillium atrosanguineum]KAJ5150121.1 hypothetical protein N7448_001699 [Penicillium atrosanguineum]KAJ5305436.1 Major facilitator superfamily domain general substrate transporter [Penicillium atrosanguineum]KAJ5324897.1 hypothetical protein N7476_003497 [Penicillium atrosanguineum]
MSEFLSSINIRNMNLNKRNVRFSQRMPQRNTSMRQCTEVDKHRVDIAARFMVLLGLVWFGYLLGNLVRVH